VGEPSTHPLFAAQIYKLPNEVVEDTYGRKHMKPHFDTPVCAVQKKVQLRNREAFLVSNPA